MRRMSRRLQKLKERQRAGPDGFTAMSLRLFGKMKG